MTTWHDELPPGWELKRLRRVAQLNPSKREIGEVARDAEVSFIPMEAVGEEGSLQLDRTRPIAEVETGYTYFRDDDVTFAKITPCFENGKGALMRGLIGGFGFGTTELTVLRPDPAMTTPEFLYRWLSSTAFRGPAEGAMYGAGGQKRVPDEFVREFVAAFPPLPEQVAIAAFLDRETAKIDALVEEQKRLIDLLKEKRQAAISHAVTKGLNPSTPMKDSGIEWLGEVPKHWDVTKIGRYISILSGFAFPSSGFSLEESDVRLLRGTNVGVGSIKWDDTVYWPRKNDDGLGRFELRENQIVVGMDRPWIKEGVRVARVSADDLPCLLLQRVTALSVRDGMTEDFAFYLLSSEMFVAYFTPDMTGVSVPHLSPEQIANFVVPIPPLEDQAAIVQHIQKEMAAINALLTEAEAAVLLLQERRAALISAVVTGRINVQKRTDVQHDQSDARNAVGFEIVRRLAHRPTFGRVKLQKIVYLAETYAGVRELNGHYQREAAGPLDRQLIADIETLLQRNGDVSIDQPEGRGGAVSYRFAGPSAKAEREDLGRLLGDRRERFEQVLTKVGDLDTKGAEAVATLFAVWNDALIDQTPMTDEGILTAFLSEWHPEKPLKFKRDELHTWLGWLRRNGIIPMGRGPRTQTGRLVI